MNHAKIDPISIDAIREKGVESIVDWFEQHKQSFYTLGWSYLSNQRQMEELFYQSIIKIHKELPRFKREISFEAWATSIFIHTCRELSNVGSLLDLEESETRQDLFKAFDQLKMDEKDAVVLAYIKGISREEAADILKVSVEEMKENLYSGIQSLKKWLGYGASFNGCKEYHKYYLDYLERNLERSKKIDLEEHIYHCQDCQEDLATFQDVLLTLLNYTKRMENFHAPSDFMENVKARLADKTKHKQRKKKKRIRIGIVIASVLALLVSLEVFTRAFSNLYYTYTEENQELRAYLQQGMGERLNLEAQSDGVKIKIKSVIADDVQTFVFYEIEDTTKEIQYAMNFVDGVIVENAPEIIKSETYPRYYPPDLSSEVNKKEKNVYHGKVSLPPLTKDNGIIKLKVEKLQRLIRDSSNRNDLRFYGNMEFKTGDWHFEIPVTKLPSREYALEKETAVERIPVRFDKLIFAPTATILQFAINNEQQEKRLEVLNFNHLEVNGKKAKANIYGNSFLNGSNNWFTFQTQFDPLIGEKPKEVNVQFESAYLSVKNQKTIELDASREYPQTFEYAGSTISIDQVEVGAPSKVVISNHDIKNRAYETLQYSIIGEDEKETSSMERGSEGVFMDKNWKEYNGGEIPSIYDEVEQPRYFFTVQSIGLQYNNSGENVIPKRLEIYGYNTTKYPDDVVKIPLK